MTAPTYRFLSLGAGLYRNRAVVLALGGLSLFR
jgi:hypothetical protein